MSTFIPGAQLKFPLQQVLEAAEQAVAATDHHMLHDEIRPRPALWWVKDDGTYMMSNAVMPEDASAIVVYADGWGPGTDADDVLGGDDFGERFDLCIPSGGNGTTTLLEALRSAIRDGDTYLFLEVSADRNKIRVGTGTSRA